MPDLKAALSDAIEGYFRALERDGYRPEGCSGDDLADVLLALPGVAVIQLPEPDRGWATYDAWTVDESYVVAAGDNAVILEDEETVTSMQVNTAQRLAERLLASVAAILSEGEAQ